MNTLETLFDLLEQASTIRQVQAFLKERGVPSSAGSWETLVEGRLRPALDDGRITQDDLLFLLAEAEEFGRQHVFLYRRKRGRDARIPDAAAISRWVKNTPDEELIRGPRLLTHPDEPTLAELRIEQDALSIKVIETRTLIEFLGEHEQAAGRFVREYRRQPVRAVNIMRLHGDGLLELRIYSHRSQDGTYDEDVAMMWVLLAGLIESDDYAEWSLLRAKQALWDERSGLKGRIRFSKSSLRDTTGTTMDCSTGTMNANLYDDDAAEAGLSTFQRTGNAYADRHNVWWVEQRNGVPSRDIHVLLAGAPNEFAVTMQCSRSDYEHVLADLRRFNR